MNDSDRVALIVRLLEKYFGIPQWDGRSQPLDNLIKTILSQSTNDRNRDRAFEALQQKFSSWEQVMTASPAEIAAAIRVAGLANQKSVRVKDILNWINQRYGSLNLDFICDMAPAEVIATFMQLKGIGIKTISVVLLFSCGVDIFPVDTHVHRICRRIGFVPENASAEKTHWLMQPLVPTGKAFSLHNNLLQLGRTICKARQPQCAGCPVAEECNFAQLKNGSKSGR